MAVGLLTINTKISAVEKQLQELTQEKENLSRDNRWVRKVRERERKFKKMTKPEKRVAVAKDVLSLIAQDRIKAKAGTYLRLEGLEGLRLPAKQEVQEVLMEAPSCTACAVGSIFYCTLLRADNLTVGEFHKLAAGEHSSWDDEDEDEGSSFNAGFGVQSGLYESVRWLFGTKQLSLIEAAFERSETIGIDDLGKKSVRRATDFGGSFSSDRDRLAAIMKNIIENEGTFKP